LQQNIDLPASGVGATIPWGKSIQCLQLHLPV